MSGGPSGLQTRLGQSHRWNQPRPALRTHVDAGSSKVRPSRYSSAARCYHGCLLWGFLLSALSAHCSATIFGGRHGGFRAFRPQLRRPPLGVHLAKRSTRGSAAAMLCRDPRTGISYPGWDATPSSGENVRVCWQSLPFLSDAVVYRRPGWNTHHAAASFSLNASWR